MVSKSVLVAFVALCVAQAFVSAAPREETALLGAHQLRGDWDCLKELTKSLSVLKDLKGVVDDVSTLISNTKAAKAACATDADGKPADAAAVKECRKAAQNKLYSAIIDEIIKAGENVSDDLPIFEKIIDKCF